MRAILALAIFLAGGRNDYMFEIHRIAGVKGNRVTFAEPIHLDLPHIDNITLWTIDYIIEECDIEGMTLAGNYRGLFKHHSGSHHGEDFRMPSFENAFNCWDNDLRFTDYSKAIRMHRSGFNTVANWLETMVQFDLGRPQAICRIDLVWRESVPDRSVRLELETACGDQAWTSAVNDEPVWESCVVCLGSTLIKAPIPRSADSVTSLYFPERQCQYVRLLFSGFPNDSLAEIRVLGRVGTTDAARNQVAAFHIKRGRGLRAATGQAPSYAKG